MHELSVCLSLLDQVQAIAREHGATRVERILLRIGPLSGVEGELLRNAYPLAAAGTLAEGAVLDIEPAAIRVHCTACGAESDAAANRLLCPACGSPHTRLISGDELLLARVELVVADVGADAGPGLGPDATPDPDPDADGADLVGQEPANSLH
jgi:hydrogenase nickel incorporation protein HypA/HybF